MFRKLTVLASISAMLATFDASAVCTAANPNAAIPEDTPTSAFTDNGNGTVTHNLSGLMWKKCPQGRTGATCATGSASSMGWSAALAAAVADSTAGHNDWRLPNKKELEALIEGCGSQPSINQTVFPNTPPTGSFWSSTTYASEPTVAWDVDFTNGQTFNDDKTNTYHVRLVRNGQPFEGFDAQQPIVVSAVLDVDLSAPLTKYDALSDGLLVIRHLFGLTGPSLTFNALGLNAQRTDPGAITTYLNGVATQLDIDGNGQTFALTDGLLIIRYLFGLRGPALINGAFDPAGSNNTAELIEAKIQSLMP